MPKKRGLIRRAWRRTKDLVEIRSRRMYTDFTGDNVELIRQLTYEYYWAYVNIMVGLAKEKAMHDLELIESMRKSLGSAGLQVVFETWRDFVRTKRQRERRDQEIQYDHTRNQIAWGGQFENMERAMKTLMVIVPLTVVAIYFLLFLMFNSMKLAALIITVLPFASIGGVFGLAITGEYLSVPASVGFIALWGIAVLNGVVLVTYVRTLREDGMPLAQAIRFGCEQRFRPVMMTATVALLGLVPFLFATGPGSEVQRPLAIVVIGGLITSTLLTLVVLPVLYRWFEPPIESKLAEQV
jgi:Cu/Ag efflux pump CusA